MCSLLQENEVSEDQIVSVIAVICEFSVCRCLVLVIDYADNQAGMVSDHESL